MYRVLQNIMISLTAVVGVVLLGITVAFSQNLAIDRPTASDTGVTVTFTVSITNAPNDVDALGFDITFDPNILDFDSDRVTRGPLVESWEQFSVVDQGAGRLRVGGFTVADPIRAGESGVLVQLNFFVLGLADTILTIENLVDDVASFPTGPGQFTATSLFNISTRGVVGTEADVLIGGFIIEGTTPKTVLIRALGPTLGTPPFNVPGVLAEPTLTLFSGPNSLQTNDNWNDHARQVEMQANINPGPPPDAREAAILVTLAPGPYTAIVSGVGGTSGVGLVEVYEFLGGNEPASLFNISTRGRVGTDADVLIGGFIIDGEGPKTVLIRALGPTLGAPPFNVPGVLADPMMDLFDERGTRLEGNDNWRDHPRAAEIAANTNPGPPPHELEAAILATLSPGAYTAIVRGVGNGTGVALVEVYDLN